MDTDGHVCLLPFDTDDPSFSLGFEAGRIWAALRAAPEDVVEETVHAANAEMMIRMAEATERTFEAEDLDDHWVVVTFGPAPAVPAG